VALGRGAVLVPDLHELHELDLATDTRRSGGLTLFEGVLFFGGILLHESAHAVAARRSVFP
jgi:hypothetical protein